MGVPLHTVAVSDDDPNIRNLFQEVIPQLGYDFVGATATGQEAIELVRTRKPDILIIDFHMPDLDGLEITRRVVPLGKTAVILLTGDADPALPRQAMDLGASGYLRKPFDVRQLPAILESAWHRFQTVKTLQEQNQSLNETLEVRKLLEKAKGILMEQQGYTEQEAHQTIQKMSQDQGISVKELCRSLIQVRMVLGGKSKNPASRKAA